jgi:hypothetical protein
VLFLTWYTEPAFRVRVCSLSQAVLHFVSTDFLSPPHVLSFFLIAQLDFILGAVAAISGRSAAADWSSIVVVNRFTPLQLPPPGPPALSNRRSLQVRRHCVPLLQPPPLSNRQRLWVRHRRVPPLQTSPSPSGPVSINAAAVDQSSRGTWARSVSIAQLGLFRQLSSASCSVGSVEPAHHIGLVSVKKNKDYCSVSVRLSRRLLFVVSVHSERTVGYSKKRLHRFFSALSPSPAAAALAL